MNKVVVGDSSIALIAFVSLFTSVALYFKRILVSLKKVFDTVELDITV
jgi:hypothetical protein